MAGVDVFVPLVLGLVVRLGIPLGLTAMMIWILYRLDLHWQGKAQSKTKVLACNPGCWNVKGCPGGDFSKCQAYQNSDVPCWHLFRDKQGQLQQRCLACKVFREAGIPVTS